VDEGKTLPGGEVAATGQVGANPAVHVWRVKDGTRVATITVRPALADDARHVVNTHFEGTLIASYDVASIIWQALHDGRPRRGSDVPRILRGRQVPRVRRRRRRPHRGKAVQVDPILPKLKPPEIKRMKLN
jgi:hypothetical protein